MNDAQDPGKPAVKGAREASSASTEDGDEESSGAHESHEPSVCVPCHGAGKVISNIDEKISEITCPWCRGGGERLTGVDAQEWQQEQAVSKRH